MNSPDAIDELGQSEINGDARDRESVNSRDTKVSFNQGQHRKHGGSPGAVEVMVETDGDPAFWGMSDGAVDLHRFDQLKAHFDTGHGAFKRCPGDLPVALTGMSIADVEASAVGFDREK